ncbi:MAG: hypothetical protein ACI9L9_000319 [Marivirga sp.]|jgi:hypothetical protein
MPFDLIINSSADDMCVFRIAGDMNVSSAVRVTLTGGAQAKNIFWQVAVEVGTTAHLESVVLFMNGITFQTGASFQERALRQTAVILDANAVTKP